jgi:hypothetical protein
MKRLLAKTGLPKTIGLRLEEDMVVLSQIVSTPFGPVEIAGFGQPAVGDEVPAVIRRLPTPLLRATKLRHVPAAIGLPAGRVCYLTRPVHSAASDASPEVLLHEALRWSNVSTGEMVADVVTSGPDKRPVASIASCNKKWLTWIAEPSRRWSGR